MHPTQLFQLVRAIENITVATYKGDFLEEAGSAKRCTAPINAIEEVECFGRGDFRPRNTMANGSNGPTVLPGQRHAPDKASQPSSVTTSTVDAGEDGDVDEIEATQVFGPGQRHCFVLRSVQGGGTGGFLRLSSDTNPGYGSMSPPGG